MIQGFKEFILRGNVIDLAVAVVIGAAFTTIVNTLVTGLFNPVIGLIFRASSLENIKWVLTPATETEPENAILYGSIIAALIQFVIVAIVLYFAFVLPINHVKKIAFAKKEADVPAVSEDTPPTELELLTDIRNLLATNGVPSTTNHGKHTE
ncbi:large conductance mechanosensitive channel protein MscL [Microbacteriaceae bacterium VKM Ac-2855]|nr:large conductance mechanosensitive channel protein MscL [Microbacteriaceae bacterium VKM Ac-2855]